MSNTQIVKLADGREVLLSYGVPVAAYIPQGIKYDAPFVHSDGTARYSAPVSGYIKTARKWSVTTSKHANAYCIGGTVVPDDVFVRLIAPIAPTGR